MTTRPDALIVLNVASHGGHGARRWAQAEPAVSAHVRPRVVETDLDGRWQGEVLAAVRNGTRVFIAAGGDGTVNALLNALLDSRGPSGLEEVKLGAVGLGSSNDFHKPYRTVVAGVPLRVDPTTGARRDVGVARYRGAAGDERVRYFTVSASIGLTAEANRFFNQGDWLLRAVKPHATSLAILYAALHTIVVYRNIQATLETADSRRQMAITNLSVLKTPYLSGAFRFDTPVLPDDGLFDVNLCVGMNRVRAIGTLVNLARGRFLGQPHTVHLRLASLRVALDAVAALEVDGEVVMCKQVDFSLLGERIGVCE